MRTADLLIYTQVRVTQVFKRWTRGKYFRKKKILQNQSKTFSSDDLRDLETFE